MLPNVCPVVHLEMQLRFELLGWPSMWFRWGGERDIYGDIPLEFTRPIFWEVFCPLFNEVINFIKSEEIFRQDPS